MAKLTKVERRNHALAEDLLHSDKPLSWEDKEFIYRNWHEGATHNNGNAGAFFTPFEMALDFALEVGGGRIIDLCAGSGILSFGVLTRLGHYGGWSAPSPVEIVCVEYNPDYLAIGKRLVPEATWINADVFDVLDMDLGKFDYAISNPPFGKVKRSKNSPGYSGADFEFHVIDIASRIADYGVFIVPQNNAGFNYSGKRFYERQTEGKAVKFQQDTGLYFECGIGVDTSIFRNEWKGVSPATEIVSVTFNPNDIG
ncbi:methyltransferase [Sinorhizobium phage phiN3]|uniref:Methyltransferase n=1 Tax=Sinorhizobium phage phiN3 TaxID=1647405 RepID=A0A0F6WCW1_9CAUD|nr:DNA methyltransferase [Sinorhizobium phage phiN3]AKF13545.1 methyltransferase [Sinorhizobium phage phiN3]